MFCTSTVLAWSQLLNSILFIPDSIVPSVLLVFFNCLTHGWTSRSRAVGLKKYVYLCLFLNFLSVKWSEKLLKYQLTELGKPSKKLDILWQCANFNCHLPTLPNYDMNIYDKAVIIEAPTHFQVIMTNIKIVFFVFWQISKLN